MRAVLLAVSFAPMSGSRAGEPPQLHELAPADRLAAVMRLMDSGAGAELLGRYVQAAAKPALATARAVCRLLAVHYDADSSEADRRRFLVFARLALDSADDEVRVQTLSCLARVAQRGELDDVLAALASAASPAVRKAALESAGALAGPALTDALSGIAADDARPERERAAAVHALAGIVSPQSVAALSRIAAGADARLAANAVAALSRMPLSEALAAALDAAAGRHPEARLAAFRGLVNYRLCYAFSRSQVEQLADRLGQERGSTRLYLMRLLAAVGNADVLPAIRRTLEAAGSDAEAVAPLVQGLGLGGLPAARQAGAAEALPLVKSALERGKAASERLRGECYLAAGRLGTPEAVGWLIERLGREEAMSGAVNSIFEGLTAARAVPADAILPLLSGAEKRPPGHLLLLAVAKGPLDAAGNTFQSFNRLLASDSSGRGLAGSYGGRVPLVGMLLLARRGHQQALAVADEHKDIFGPLLAAVPTVSEPADDVGWQLALYGLEDTALVSRLLAARLENGRSLSPLIEACTWNPAALAAALGAWARLPASFRERLLAALAHAFELEALLHLAAYPPAAARRHIAFFMGVEPYEPAPAAVAATGAVREPGRLVWRDGRLWWRQPDGMLRTPIILLAGDVPDCERLAGRLLELGGMVIDEPFMPVDVAVVRETGAAPPCACESVMGAAQAAALAASAESSR